MDNGLQFKTLLVPTDGSTTSTAAGKLAIDVAAIFGSRLIFMYVVDESVIEELARSSQQTSLEASHELRLSGQRYLDYLVALAGQHNIVAETVLRQGTPHLEIVKVCREQQVDLIVMGYVGRRGPRRILIGSVTERVIEYAQCPILIAKGEAVLLKGGRIHGKA
jgi:nucleotide-binding universal stress UspA family protein